MKTVKGWHFPDNEKEFLRYINEYPETTYQQETIDSALKYVQNFNLAIDVGANVGLHTVRFAKKFKKIHAFEPSTYNFECLFKNGNPCKNITYHKQGLGNGNSKKTLSIPKTSTNSGIWSIKDFKRMSEDELYSEIVKVSTLDSFNLSPDLIKIDTQGYELEVLQGSIKTIERSSPVIITEAENWSERILLARFFTKLNYRKAAVSRRDFVWVKMVT